jgi:hypothetical protein
MFLRKVKSLHRKKEDRLWKVIFGTNLKEGKAVDILFHHYNPVTGKDKYKIYEPLLLQDLHPSSYEYKLFMEGYPVKRRIFKNLNLALETLKDYYQKLFHTLAEDPHINSYLIEPKEYDYLKHNLPDNNQTKLILTKIKKVHGVKEKE